MDKQKIQQVLDATSDISNKIKDYAQKQGVSSSDLDKIADMPLKSQNSGNTPVSILKQSADDVKNNVAAAKNDKPLNEDELNFIAVQLGWNLGDSGSIIERFRSAETNSDLPSGDELESLLINHSKDLTDNEIRFLKMLLYENPDEKIPVTEEQSKQNVLDLMPQAIDSLQKEELNETDSILKYVTSSGMLDLSPNVESVNLIQLQSKHGFYQIVDNGVEEKMYNLLPNWVLKSQNGIEFKIAHIRLTNSDGTTEKHDASINEGVIRYSSLRHEAGTYVYEITDIDGNPPPTDSRVEIVIPPKGVSSETPSTVQTTPVVPTTPLAQTPLDFTVPSQVVQEATSSSGAIVHFTISASSPGGNTGIVICVPSDGSQFPLGSTTVTCTATDVSNQKTLKKSFTVIVRDTTPPAISPFNPHNDTPDDSGAIVYFTMEAIDLVDGSITPHCDHTSGSKFPLGSTIVTCTADDSKGNHSERKLGITITKS